MISVEDAGYEMVIETISLYGETEDSLHPKPETLEDLDILFFDIQDIGSLYYTYQASLGYIMEVAAHTNTEIWVLDRPNPINGVDVQGNIVHAGYESFVSAYPIPTRHAMTMGELGLFFKRYMWPRLCYPDMGNVRVESFRFLRKHIYLGCILHPICRWLKLLSYILVCV